MTKKNKNIKEIIRNRDNGCCKKCGKYRWTDGCIAHRIADTKVNRKVYGNHIIDHPYNKLWACILNKCNDRWNIGNNPEKCKKLVNLIFTCSGLRMSVEEINEMLEG